MITALYITSSSSSSSSSSSIALRTAALVFSALSSPSSPPQQVFSVALSHHRTESPFLGGLITPNPGALVRLSPVAASRHRLATDTGGTGIDNGHRYPRVRSSPRPVETPSSRVTPGSHVTSQVACIQTPCASPYHHSATQPHAQPVPLVSTAPPQPVPFAPKAPPQPVPLTSMASAARAPCPRPEAR